MKSILFMTLLVGVYLSACKKYNLAEYVNDSEASLKGASMLSDTNFVHPGILFDSNDLYRIQSQALSGIEPWQTAYNFLKSKADSSYTMLGPYSAVERTAGVNDPGASALTNDSQMAYRNALMWSITGQQGYANKAKQIINAWADSLTTFSGGDDMLMAAWYGFNLVNAAEILRYTNAGWSAPDIVKAEDMFRNVIYPVIHDWKRGRAGNWDTAITKTILGIGVFLNDRDIFDSAINFYNSFTENSNGTLYKNIYSSGQNFESARDQTHAQFGLGGLAEACEIAWKQGVDLYGEQSNRLLTGYEYTARYNMGNDGMPFQSNVYGSVISATARGSFQPMYEMVYNHYKNRQGMADSSLRFTRQVVDYIRSGGCENTSSQLPGFGTLLFNESSPAAPAVTDSVTVSEDAYVFGGSTGTNYGSATLLYAKNGDGTNVDRIAFLKFDLSALSFSPTTAKLKLVVDATTQAGMLSALECGSTSWTSSTVKWTGKPSTGTTINAWSVTAGIQKVIKIDVSNYVTANFTGTKTFTIALTGNNALLAIKSLESGIATAPKLLLSN